MRPTSQATPYSRLILIRAEFRSKKSRRSEPSSGVGSSLTAATRIEGIRSTWEALQFACENHDLGASLPVLQAAGVKLLNKTLQMSYDDQNFRYDLPVFVINDPKDYFATEEKNVAPGKELKVNRC